MKVTTEKLPRSLLALEIELDREQVEKGLDRAARRLSQKYTIPGFRKGKAPRFIVENYFGRAALIEEATEDLVTKAFREVLDQEQIEPVGQASLQSVNFDDEPYHFRVNVPVAPTVTLPDYRAISVPFEPIEVSEELVDAAMKQRRERHVVLREPEEPRPAQHGDQLTARIESLLDGVPLEEREDDGPPPESTLALEPEGLAPGLYQGLLGVSPGQVAQIISHMPDDHENEQIRGKEITFVVEVLRVQERLLPEWDELPVLEEFEGTLDELRERTRAELAENARKVAENTAIDAYLKQLIEQTGYDIPVAMIAQEADRLLHEQGAQFERYGISLEQMLQYRGKTHDEAVEELHPQAEERLKTTLALRELVLAEGLTVDDDEIDAEVDRLLDSYEPEQHDRVRELLTGQLRSTVASTVLDKKLRQRLFEFAVGPDAMPASLAAQPDDEVASSTDVEFVEARAEPPGDVTGESAPLPADDAPSGDAEPVEARAEPPSDVTGESAPLPADDAPSSDAGLAEARADTTGREVSSQE